jgi:hypothetical protein
MTRFVPVLTGPKLWCGRWQLDPSYLSPHVNITSRLENATKLYGVPLLMSAAFYRGLESRHNKRFCRKIDCVTVKGSHEQMLLYTFDIWHVSQTYRSAKEKLGRFRVFWSQGWFGI